MFSPSSKSAVRELEVVQSVTTLGLSFGSLPPSQPVVKSVYPGTWAEEQGITSGDVLISVDGRRVEDMKRHEFMASIKARPVLLAVEAKKMDPGALDDMMSVTSATTYMRTISGISTTSNDSQCGQWPLLTAGKPTPEDVPAAQDKVSTSIGSPGSELSCKGAQLETPQEEHKNEREGTPAFAGLMKHAGSQDDKGPTQSTVALHLETPLWLKGLFQCCVPAGRVKGI